MSPRPPRAAPLALLLLLTALPACGDKSAPSGAMPTAEPAPATTTATAGAVVAAPPSGAAEPVQAPLPKGPKFIVRGRGTTVGPLYWVGAGVIACSDTFCLNDAVLYTEKGETDTYNPMRQFRFQHGYMFRKEPEGQQIRYHGDYPDICASFSYWNDRSDFGGAGLKRTGKSWGDGSCEEAKINDPANARPVRALDDALLHAPIAGAARDMIHGAGGPALIIADHALYTWNGKAWDRRDAPWKVVARKEPWSVPASYRPVRLKGGGTLIPDGGYFVDNQGAIFALDLINGKEPLTPAATAKGAVWMRTGPWLVADDLTGYYFLSAEATVKGQFAPADLPKREGAPPPPKASAPPAAAPVPSIATAAPSGTAIASAAPAVSGTVTASAAASGTSVATSAPVASGTAIASAAPMASGTAIATAPMASGTVIASAAPVASDAASAASSAAPSGAAPAAASADPDALVAPKNFTPACSTPFVFLATPRSAGGTYDATREALKGHGDLQDVLTFIEYTADGKNYFGAQAKTEADARRFLDALKDVKGMKPQLTCADLVSRVPDRYAPPPGIRLVGINLTTGDLVPFD